MNKIVLALILLFFAFIYIAAPLDFIPDFIPFIGWIDDLLVLISALYFLVK